MQMKLQGIVISVLRSYKTTRPTRKEPYTGFVFTQRPRRFQPRDYRRNEPNPVMPPQQRNHQSRHSTRSPPHLQPPTTPRPESTTEWWPPGVSHGPPPISRIPIGIIYPEIGRWEADLTNVRVRTSATRMTYPPEVVNYPVTFDWNFPRHLRKDKWTQRPDWPLESPLWSSEAYDYLEERTLPRILESGETEFPPTSPLPWWTYPPWWLQKKETETVNGTTPRPYTRKTTVKNSTTNKSVNNKHKGNGISEFPESKDAETSVGMVGKEAEETTLLPETTGLKADVSGINRKLDEDSSTYMTKSSKVKASGDAQEKDEPEKISENIQQQRKIHHKGPWWHLTVVEHFTAKTPKDQGNKRIKRSPKLVRQNAFRRKWKKFRETKNSSHTLDLNKTKSANVTEGCESPSIQHVLSNYSFTWPKINNETHSSKVYIEKVLMKSLDELKTLVTEENKPRNNLLSTLQGQTHLGIENHIADLRNIFLIAVNNYHHKKGCSLLFNVIINEIGSDMVKSLLNHTNIVRQQLDRLLGRKKGHRIEKDVYKRYVEQSKLISIYKLLYNHNFLNRDSSEKINNILKNVLNINIGFLNSNYTNTYMSSNKGEVLNHKHNSNIKHSVMKNIFRRKREDITDITECPFNLSAQSVERVVGEIVDEIVDEIPVDEINEEVKTDVLTAMHENQLKRLGKTNINKNVLREMAKIESVDEAKFRNATEDSVRKVIMKMVNEVLNTLRKNSWMKDLIIKLFEEGYSVDSVLETISNQISIEELMNGMEKDGINITRYQKRLVLDEFKGYKTLLRKMLNKEVQLWEYQLTKNQSLIRYRRDLLDAHEDDEIGLERTNHKIYIEQNIISSSKSHIPIDSKQTKNDGVENFFLNILRVKRDINDNEISKTPGLNIDDFDLNDEDLDKELAELKKSSMPKREKIKVLKKRLKGLLDQTENPKDIVFPDNFEEELMRTENFYDEEVTPSPQRFKQRIRWNVRTKKPTTKVITYPMKIRLNRGRPFVPLTTTEEQTLIMVVTKTPSRRSRTKKPPPKKVVAPTKSLHFPTKKSTESKDRFWFDFTTSPTSNKIPRSTDKFVRRTLKPAQTLPTLRTFKTMKFIQKTQQPVISIQEFLKRRNKFKKQKVEDMFNRPSKDDGEKLPDTRNLSDSEEEEFSFGAEEVTFPSVLSTSDPTNTLDKPSFEKTASSTEPLTPMSSRVVMKKTPRRKTALHQNRTRLRAPTQAYSVAGTNLTNGIGNKSDSTNPLRRKRDLTFTQPFTTLKTEDFNDVTIPPLVISKEKFRGSKKNISGKSLEDRIQLHNWSYGVKQPKDRRRYSENRTDSFETYQQEHRKWFGIRRRGVPVNNFDIDWEQMQRKMHQIAALQQHKPSMRPTIFGKLLKKNERIATPLTQATTPIFLDSSEKPSNLLDSMYRSAMKKGRTKSFDKHYISSENAEEKVNMVYPPFGKMEKDGHTAFGRLYHGKKHYQLEDSREKIFEESDLVRLVNKTYDPDFRISTHRKSTWNNRTFDPNYVFTQFVPVPGKTRTKPKFEWLQRIDLFLNQSTPNTIDLQNCTPEIERLDVLEDQTTSSIHEKNTTGNQNETYVMTRSKRVPWDNNTDIETYKIYIRSRKRFYNKTIDIAFSYFVFHKFRCGNKTRDLGYGRMSNVVNRWYNKTFVPKFRPDMFYIRNRYKRGKEFNYFKDEMNEVHANISVGEFDLFRWMQVATEANLEESNRTRSPDEEEYRENRKKKRIIEVFSSGFPFKSTPVPGTSLFTTYRWRRRFPTVATKVPTTKASFFQAVKKRGFGFLRSLFGKQESNEKDEND
ncbi:uncharacterized protein LOC129000427 [Macrosteles quadrilineatus]|uniref:uncharacterized protein LOC129000427 n=1 Tax=Macrosteles quadrilineatus TaxID=74068 RepID=UPI0023E08F71|nr:uncharacterized protein LOC129000427 [Macrosteles quadrilineatus]